MWTFRRRLITLTTLVGIGVTFSAVPASAAPSVADCTSHLLENATGSLAITSTVAAGSDVTAGDTISLDASWATPDWAEKQTLLLCVTRNGAWSPTHSAVLPVVNDSSFTWPFVMPGELSTGTNLCLREVLLGRLNDGASASETSNSLCFRSAAAVAPPTTTTTVAAPTTIQDTTSTTDDVTVMPAVSTAPPAELTEVAPADPATPPPTPELPRTGSPIELTAAVGIAAITTGRLARRLGRRRPTNI